MFAVEHPQFRGMGTTATVAGVSATRSTSRRWRQPRLPRAERGGAADHGTSRSRQRLIEAGEADGLRHPARRRNIILQIGPEPQIKIDLTSQQLRRGDVLVWRRRAERSGEDGRDRARRA